jgi:hypothetical protein
MCSQRLFCRQRHGMRVAWLKLPLLVLLLAEAASATPTFANRRVASLQRHCGCHDPAVELKHEMRSPLQASSQQLHAGSRPCRAMSAYQLTGAWAHRPAHAHGRCVARSMQSHCIVLLRAAAGHSHRNGS